LLTEVAVSVATDVSVAEGFAAWIIARNLADFHRRHPAIRIELVATNGFLTPSKREADLAIKRTGLGRLVETPEGFWGRSRLPKR
jgi:DNA-binding transcriptional LysR family regulator